MSLNIMSTTIKSTFNLSKHSYEILQWAYIQIYNFIFYGAQLVCVDVGTITLSSTTISRILTRRSSPSMINYYHRVKIRKMTSTTLRWCCWTTKNRWHVPSPWSSLTLTSWLLGISKWPSTNTWIIDCLYDKEVTLGSTCLTRPWMRNASTAGCLSNG